VSRDVFEQGVADGLFLEWAEFNGNLYGTPMPPAPTSSDTLLEIEVEGARQVRENHPDAAIIMVVPPSREVLEARLRGRGDDEVHVQARLASSDRELEIGHGFSPFVVVNDDLERATQEILSILEELRRTRRPSSLKE
jgi:guanylate kinase